MSVNQRPTDQECLGLFIVVIFIYNILSLSEMQHIIKIC